MSTQEIIRNLLDWEPRTAEEREVREELIEWVHAVEDIRVTPTS